MALKQLSVRFEPDLLEKIEIISNLEHRPVANQVVHFAALGVQDYLRQKHAWFTEHPEGGLTIEFDPHYDE